MKPSDYSKLILGILVLLPLVVVKAQQALPHEQNQSPAPSQAAPNASDPSRLQSELQQAQDKLKDWANLARYRDDNTQVHAPAPGETRVLFMGDSITDGWGRKYGKFFPGKSYINRGISGQTTPQMLIRFWPDVIDLHPAAVVILAGTND